MGESPASTIALRVCVYSVVSETAINLRCISLFKGFCEKKTYDSLWILVKCPPLLESPPCIIHRITHSYSPLLVWQSSLCTLYHQRFHQYWLMLLAWALFYRERRGGAGPGAISLEKKRLRLKSTKSIIQHALLKITLVSTIGCNPPLTRLLLFDATETTGLFIESYITFWYLFSSVSMHNWHNWTG